MTNLDDSGDLAQIQDQLRLQSSALDAAANAIVITDLHGRIIWINPAFTKLTGFSQDEVIGRNPRLLKSGKHTQDYYKDLWDTILAGEVWQGEIINQKKDGRIYTEEQTITPVRDEYGAITHFIGIKTDISLRVEAQKAANQRLKELGVLHDLAVAITDTTNEDDLIAESTRIIGASMFPDNFGILLLDQEIGILRLHPSCKIPTRLSKKQTTPLGIGLIGQVADQRQSSLIKDVRGEKEYLGWDPDTQSAICVPLVIGNDILGVINVESAEVNNFSEGDKNMLETFAGQLATAIERIRLFEEVKTLANTDSLTGIYNRRHFFELARREFERVRRYNRPLSTILLDIDHFKQVNDTYGHAIGDQVLNYVAVRISEGLRKVDLFGRYGGEEFVILLPETDINRAQMVAERLRHRISAKVVDTEYGAIKIRVSIGVAELRPSCPDLDTLLDQADRALYNAKNTGRDRVSIWNP